MEIYRAESQAIRDKRRQENPIPNSRGRQVQSRSSTKEIGEVYTEKWEQRWTQSRDKYTRSAPTWKDDWEFQPLHIYDNKPKHLATAIMLLRTEVLGLRAWLASIGVPDTEPTCTCGHSRQTLAHVLAFCPDTREARLKLITRAGTSHIAALLKDKDKAAIAGQWLLDTNLLEHFQIAIDVTNTDTTKWRPFNRLGA
jgi:hypothetical protein